MPSSQISHSEAKDLLHKLITESTKVQGVLFNPKNGFKAFVSGTAHVSPEGGVAVIERKDDPRSSMVSFDPSKAVAIRYGDDRAIREQDSVAADVFRREFASGLTFLFADGSGAAIFEIKS